MPWGAAIVAGGAIASSAIAANAANGAANTLSSGYQSAQGQVQNTQAANVSNITANEQPYTALGTTAANSLNTGEQPGGQFTQNFNLSDLQTDPGYLFDLQQGNQAVQRSAAAQGTLNSGGTLAAISQYTTGLASNEVSNAYNRYTTNQTNQYNRLYQLAGLGQTATTAVNQADQNQANVDSNAIQTDTVGSASANAAGQIASSNAITGGIAQITGGSTIGGTNGNQGGSLSSLASLM